ncbi:MAG: tRNA (5-methylaminomethyl-2-thiouridine)(34)-methyltransferase MnmD [Planctomycetota bacterium]
MPIPERQTFASSTTDLRIQVTDDDSRTFQLTDGRDAYHSGCGALTETRSVYLSNSGVADRLSRGQETGVLELGLGTGMAMLVTLEQALISGTPLTYVALESRWLTADLLREVRPETWLAHRPDLAAAYLQWRASLPDPIKDGCYRWSVAPTEATFGLSASEQLVEVHVGDACDWKIAPKQPRFDAIFFDAFAPATSPELWTPAVFERMFEATKPGGNLTTYCVNRAVRDIIGSVGFEVQCVPGPKNGKREVLIANKPIESSDR